MATRHSCDVVVIGAGLSGLYTARSLAVAGVDVLVIEAQGRVGGRTLTIHFSDGTFVDDDGQWVSPGQHCIVKLADELGIRLFPSWSKGATVHWRAGKRSISNDLFLPDDGDAAIVAPEAAKVLTAMAEALSPEEPWAAPQSAEWDRTTLHSWLKPMSSQSRHGEYLPPRLRVYLPVTACQHHYSRHSSGFAVVIR